MSDKNAEQFDFAEAMAWGELLSKRTPEDFHFVKKLVAEMQQKRKGNGDNNGR